jgi:hypothetical protein
MGKLNKSFMKLSILGFFLLWLGACATKSAGPQAPVLLRFVADQDLGLVVHPVDWFRSAEQDNPGVDCTLKLETQGPPENVYSCVVKDARNVFIVKITETYKADLQERHLTKITIDTKWSATRDLWIEALRKAAFKESPKNPLGTKGNKWEFVSPDETSQVTLFWNRKGNALTVWILPFVKVPPATKDE